MKKGLRLRRGMSQYLPLSVGRIDLMKKGLRRTRPSCRYRRPAFVGRIDLMKKGLRLNSSFIFFLLSSLLEGLT